MALTESTEARVHALACAGFTPSVLGNRRSAISRAERAYHELSWWLKARHSLEYLD